MNIQNVNSARKYHAAAYRTVSTIFLLLALGGLFIGLLGTVVQPFASVYVAAGGTVPAEIANSLFGYLWQYFEGTFSNFEMQTTIGFFAELVRLLFLAIAILSAIIYFIVSLCSKRAAKGAALTSGILVTIAYLWLFLAAAFKAAGQEGAALGLDLFDLSILVIAVLSLITLCVTGIAMHKGAGALSVIGLLLTLCVALACVYPASLMREGLSDVLVGDFNSIYTDGTSLFFVYASTVLLGLLSFNVAASVCRLAGKKGFAFDAVRYFLLLAAVVVFYVAAGLEVGFLEFFTLQLIPAILFVGVSALLFIIFLIAAIVAGRRARRIYIESIVDEYDEEDDDDDERTHATFSPTYINNVGSPAAAAAPQPIILQQPPMYQQPIFQPVYPQTYVQPYVQPVYYPMPQTAQESEQEELSEFEQSMIALAKGEAPAPQPAAPAPEAAPAPAPQPAAPAPAVAPAPAPQTDIYGTYVYDTFFSPLPTNEKNEFGDLFIGKKSGDFGLPTYKIGEDNSEFFSKFFIYLGKIRPNISTELLSKIYNYVNHK